MRATLAETYEIKSKIAVPWKGANKSFRVLGRIITYARDGIGYEADPKHSESSVRSYGMEDCKRCSIPYVAEVHPEGLGDLNMRRRNAPTERSEATNSNDHEDEKLDPEAKATYQSVVAKLNYYALDRTDLQFPVKEVMRYMSAPSVQDLTRLKRVLGHVQGRRRGIHTVPYAPLGGYTRKSTSGGSIMWESGLMKTWSKTQSTIALSSGEAELGAVVKGATEALGMQSVLKDFLGRNAKLHIAMMRRQ